MRTSKYPGHIPSITDAIDIAPSNTENIHHIYSMFGGVRIRPTFGCSVAAQGRCISLDPLSLLQSFQPISLSFRSYSNGRSRGFILLSSLWRQWAPPKHCCLHYQQRYAAYLLLPHQKGRGSIP